MKCVDKDFIQITEKDGDGKIKFIKFNIFSNDVDLDYTTDKPYLK